MATFHMQTLCLAMKILQETCCSHCTRVYAIVLLLQHWSIPFWTVVERFEGTFGQSDSMFFLSAGKVASQAEFLTKFKALVKFWESNASFIYIVTIYA